ncbi:hypothetical protein OKA05_28160 [Luteolibacter arcticus]|uniref:Transmembrane protein n=1 Tax=Luteolibacter arcticus TaxID=1581411 RepID=A0ABT3GSF6_9BACT|nr:hypothetical protein [Luteolibacter arcticus]MCW1926458.1 hypothetical protein [Luteolibacter arcticus]
MSHGFATVFPRRLRYWSLHCALNSLPSLIIALWALELRHKPLAIAAMFSAIATFILLYATLTSLPGPLAEESNLLSKSLRLGTKIRSWISGVSLLLIPAKGLFFMPDFWCGWAAIGLYNWVLRTLGIWTQRFPMNRGNQPDSFLPVYTVTLLEGLILSFLLLMISFFALLVLQAKERRRSFAEARLSERLSAADSPARLQ